MVKVWGRSEVEPTTDFTRTAAAAQSHSMLRDGHQSLYICIAMVFNVTISITTQNNFLLILFLCNLN